MLAPWWHDKYPDLKHVWCYRSHSIPYAGFQVLKVVVLNLVDNVLHITPQERKSTGVKAGAARAQEVRPLQRTYFMTDVDEDTRQLQNAVRSFLSAMEPEGSVAFVSLVYFYNGRHVVRYNGRILCVRVAPALIWRHRRPSNWFISADPSPSHLSVQVIPNMAAEMWRRLHLSRA
jgi:hypothetical protein